MPVGCIGFVLGRMAASQPMPTTPTSSVVQVADAAVVSAVAARPRMSFLGGNLGKLAGVMRRAREKGESLFGASAASRSRPGSPRQLPAALQVRAANTCPALPELLSCALLCCSLLPCQRIGAP